MRIFEIADAEAQLSLLRTIIDNTWTAIAKQAEDQRKAEAQRQANAKLKPRRRKADMGRPLSVPTHKPAPPPPKPQDVNPKLKPQPKAQPPSSNQKLGQPYDSPVSRLNSPSLGTKTGSFGRDSGA